MNSDDIVLENLPSELRQQLRSLAAASGRTEEDLVVDIVRAVLDQRDNPDSPALQGFVDSAKKFLKKT